MDEPLSNLDAKLRVQMRAEIKTLQRDLGVTTIYVTHDQVEAMTMGDRVAVMRKGRLQQVAPPEELYQRPRERVRGWLHRQPGHEHARGGDRATERRPEIVVSDTRIDLDDQMLATHSGACLPSRAARSSSASARRASRTRRSSTETAPGCGAEQSCGRRSARRFCSTSRSRRVSGHRRRPRAGRGRRRRSAPRPSVDRGAAEDEAGRALRPSDKDPRGGHDRGRDRQARAPLLRPRVGARAL